MTSLRSAVNSIAMPTLKKLIRQTIAAKKKEKKDKNNTINCATLLQLLGYSVT